MIGTTGQTVAVTCNTGYTGGGTATCSTGGTFNALTCSANTCSSTNVANSDKSASNNIAGTTGQTVIVTCDAGYTGGGTATCGTSGQFNTLTCSAKTCTEAGGITNSNKAASNSIKGMFNNNLKYFLAFSITITITTRTV